VPLRISGHLTRDIFDRYNIIDEDDLADAGRRLEEYAAKRKLERAAKLRLVKCLLKLQFTIGHPSTSAG